jgi:hypothetical protein
MRAQLYRTAGDLRQSPEHFEGLRAPF